MDTISKILVLLSLKERRRGAMVLSMVIIMALLEAVGVASVIPFLSVLGNPDTVHTSQILSKLYNGIGFDSINSFLMVLGAAAFLVIIFSAFFRILTYYILNRFVQMRRHSISERLLETYLRQPYTFFLDRHSGDMAKNILSEVDQVISNVFQPCIQIIAYSVVILSIVGMLMYINPFLTTWVILIIGGIYLGIFISVRSFLTSLGRDRVKANQERFTAACEALGGIKDIKLLGRETTYLSKFHRPSMRLARYQATNETISKIPKFAVEAVAFGGIIALVLVLLASQGGLSGNALGAILPMLGLFAFASYKILPATQNIFHGFARLRFGMGALEVVSNDINLRSNLAVIYKKVPQPLVPRKLITLNNLTYTYPNASTSALKNINLEIKVGTSVGLVGSTGAGKTTLVDVILGLLKPQEGEIYVDSYPVFGNIYSIYKNEKYSYHNKNAKKIKGSTSKKNIININPDIIFRSWQQTLGYVPQNIFLTDTTVAENIALGVPMKDIDMDQVKKCAKMAHIHEFIINDLDWGYDTLVGERGIRLSGGQRQRIGIARALYNDPKVMVFDEATSALDTGTEKAVMQAIEHMHGERTIIIIAHRLSTVKKCDNICLLKNGKLIAQGTYEEMIENSKDFNKMTLAN